VDAQVNGYGSHLWGTFRQWVDEGAAFRKGKKASYVVFYKEIEVDDETEGESDSKRRLFARATPVFNADQIDGFGEPTATVPVDETAERGSLHRSDRRNDRSRCKTRLLHSQAG